MVATEKSHKFEKGNIRRKRLRPVDVVNVVRVATVNENVAALEVRP
jgi:hypothetical protein